MPRTDKSKKSALDALLAHVAPANAGRKPEAPTTQRQLAVVHETDPFAKYRLGAEGLKSVEPFADLNDHDRIVVLALVDLLKHGEHVGGIIESVHNWVGRFVFEVLLSTASLGPLEINRRPQLIQNELDEALENMRFQLGVCAKLQTRYGTMTAADFVRLDDTSEE